MAPNKGELYRVFLCLHLILPEIYLQLGENLLVLLSGLTVFSSLVDMSDYLDKFQPLQVFAKWISLFVVLAAIVIFIAAIYRKMKK